MCRDILRKVADYVWCESYISRVRLHGQDLRQKFSSKFMKSLLCGCMYNSLMTTKESAAERSSKLQKIVLCSHFFRYLSTVGNAVTRFGKKFLEAKISSAFQTVHLWKHWSTFKSCHTITAVYHRPPSPHLQRSQHLFFLVATLAGNKHVIWFILHHGDGSKVVQKVSIFFSARGDAPLDREKWLLPPKKNFYYPCCAFFCWN